MKLIVMPVVCLSALLFASQPSYCTCDKIEYAELKDMNKSELISLYKSNDIKYIEVVKQSKYQDKFPEADQCNALFDSIIRQMQRRFKMTNTEIKKALTR